MEQQEAFMINDYSQLKAISDPLRFKLLLYLIEKSYTGQQLSGVVNIPRAKVHYHLKELEKVGLITIVKEEEKNGIIQKYYRAVARWYYPSEQLLPKLEDETVKQSVINLLERAVERTISTPADFFKFKSVTTEKNPLILSHTEFNLSEQDFIEFTTKFWDLVNEYKNKDGENIYYLGAVGFQTNEKVYE